MFMNELKYRWSLARLQRGRAKTIIAFRKKWETLLKAKGNRDAREALRSEEQFNLEEWDEEIDQLTTGFLRDQARKLIVPLPSIDDGNLWFESKMFGFRLLTREGVKVVRNDIRAEQKARWDYWQSRVAMLAGLIGIVGGILGMLAFFKPPHH